MKSIPSGLFAHYQNGTTSLATCWKVTRVDGEILGFTDYDSDIVFEGLTYIARSGFSPTDSETNTRLAVDNLNANGILDSEILVAEDLASGKYDYAGIEIFLVNAKDVSQGRDILLSGKLGEIKVNRGSFAAEVRGLANAYMQQHSFVYQPGCRAQLGDSRCQVDLTPFTFSGSVSSVSSNGLVITDPTQVQANGFFDYGKVTMTSGASNGLSVEVKTYTVGVINLQLQFAQGIEVGDTFNIQAGCGKRFNEDCVTRFNNAINFRGEPHIPGMDKIMLFGGQK